MYYLCRRRECRSRWKSDRGDRDGERKDGRPGQTAATSAGKGTPRGAVLSVYSHSRYYL